jgi:hypothetical protein
MMINEIKTTEKENKENNKSFSSLENPKLRRKNSATSESAAGMDGREFIINDNNCWRCQ